MTAQNPTQSTNSDLNEKPDASGSEQVAEKDVKNAQGLSAPTVYEIISREGLEEMGRPAKSLWFSGIVAGLAISVSLYSMAALRVGLEGVSGAGVLEKLGYSVGFLIVVLSRLQLFTENTITPILPLFRTRDKQMVWQVARLWGIVFLANVCGTFIAAVIPLYSPMFAPEHVTAMMDISLHFAHRPLGEVFVSAIPAGFLVAAMVWMLPSAKHFGFSIIVLMTFIIAILDTSHVIVGSAELFMAWLGGHATIFDAIWRVLLSAAGNILGGTVLFAGLAYAQVSEEINP